MMSLEEIKELNNRFKKDNSIAYEYNGVALQTLNCQYFGVDLMLSDEGLEFQVSVVRDFKGNHQKIWETIAMENIDIDSISCETELLKKEFEIIDKYWEKYKKDIDEEGFVINREGAKHIDYMVYKGIQVRYIYDTNTLIFSKENAKNDEDDLDTIVYRNYSQFDIERYIDKELVKENK